MQGQISLAEWLNIPDPGERTEDETLIGRTLTWEEAIDRIGKVIWRRVNMDGWHYYIASRPEKILRKAITYYRHKNGKHWPEQCDRLICYEGTRQRSLIDSWSYNDRYIYPESDMFYEVKK